MSRRTMMAKAASLAPLVPLAAFADLKKAGDGEIYKRADDGKLNAARAIERAKTGDLVDGSSATCAELDKLLEVDRAAIEFEKEKLDGRFLDERGNKGKVEATEKKLQEQVDRLKEIRAKKGCSSAGANLKQGTDFDVYKRADEGVLNSARVIDRARSGKLVDGSGASCAELQKIIAVDKKAVQFEKDKLEAMGSKADAKEKQIVAEAEKAIESQIKKLEGLIKTKGCK
jgi:predicted transcriptional regulator